MEWTRIFRGLRGSGEKKKLETVMAWKRTLEIRKIRKVSRGIRCEKYAIKIMVWSLLLKIDVKKLFK